MHCQILRDRLLKLIRGLILHVKNTISVDNLLKIYSYTYHHYLVWSNSKKLVKLCRWINLKRILYSCISFNTKSKNYTINSVCNLISWWLHLLLRNICFWYGFQPFVRLILEYHMSLRALVMLCRTSEMKWLRFITRQ